MNTTGFVEEDIEEETQLEDSVSLCQIVDNIWKTDASDYDFGTEVKKRFDGVTKATFEAEVAAWCEGFKLLPPYNKDSFKQEIADMELNFQSDSNFSFETLVILYSMQVAYRNRLTAMKNIVNAHYGIYDEAYNSLSKQAFKLFNKASGSVDDRKADAALVVAPFLRMTVQAKDLLDQIDEMIKNIEFASFQLSRLLREREALGRINSSFDREGQHARVYSEFHSRIRPTKTVDEDGFEKI